MDMMKDKISKHKEILCNKTNYKPLFVNVSCDKQPHTFYDAMIDPQKAIENAENQFKYTKEVQSDSIPFIESNFMEVLIPSMLGAKVHTAPGGLIDVKPVFSDIYETEKIGEIDIFTGEMENAIKHLEYLKKNSPDYLYLNPTRPMSPLDFAVVLCGGEFYTELYAEPELAILFMENIAEATIKTIKEFKKIINQPLDEWITPRGVLFNGIRLTGDAIVNLSPKMISEIMCPLYKKFEKKFSNVMLHYCCTPAPSTHVAPALVCGGGVGWVDNWQGYKTLLKEEDYLLTNIGICTDILDKNVILSGEVKNDPFFNIKRPLIVSTYVDNIDEGKEVYRKWQDFFNTDIT